MSIAADPAQVTPVKKRSKLPLIIGLALALLGGAGGFAVVRMGLLGGSSTDSHEVTEEADGHAMAPAAFVPLEPLIINLPDPSGRRFLRFTAQVEVEPSHLADVEAVKPRIVDVLNGYLRAVEMRDLEDRTALMRLRAQMLRRIQVVTGPGQVRDLLIMEFVLN